MFKFEHCKVVYNKNGGKVMTYIQQLHDTLEEYELEDFAEVVFQVRDGKISQRQEDIIPLCELFTCDIEEMEPHAVLSITRMIFWAVNIGDIEKGLKDLLDGLSKIYEKSLLDDDLDIEYDDYFYEILCMFIANYKPKDMKLFGKMIYEVKNQDFKLKITEIIERTLEYNDREGFIENEKLFLKSIQG